MPRKPSPRTALARLFEAAPDPVYALDARYTIVYCNPALAAWTGTTVDQLIGRKVAYHSEDEPSSAPGVAAGLCPPPSAFQGHTVETHVSCMSADGKLMYRRGRFVPLGQQRSSAGESSTVDTVGVVAFLSPEDIAASRLAHHLQADASTDTLHREIRKFRRREHDRYRLESLVGRSSLMQRLRRQVEMAAAAKACVAVAGPDGSGREHVARTVFHAGNTDPQRPLIVLDANVLDEDLLRWSLEPLRDRPRASGGGTLLLRGLDDLARDAQAELQRFLRESDPAIQLLVTCGADPEQLVRQDQLSEELAAVVGTLVIRLPPLSDRIEDLPLIAQAMVEHENAELAEIQLEGLRNEALDLLCLYDWPGQLQQLREVIHAAHRRAAEGPWITAEDLPPWLTHAASAAALPTKEPTTLDLEAHLARIERDLIEDALRKAKGNKTQAATLLGMTRPKLYRRLTQLGLEDEDDETGTDETPREET